MKIADFLANFDDEDYPSQYGLWQTDGSFDPPFNESDLKEMEQRGMIDRDKAGKQFRLTMKAMAWHNSRGVTDRCN